VTLFATPRALFAGGLIAALPLAVASNASAQSIPPNAVSEAEGLERLHRESIHTRRVLADSVFVAGLVSIAGGGALLVPSGDDQAWRYAGINTAIFGVVNTIVGLLALHGIAAEEATWESDEGLAARRTPEGLARARIHAALDERRESVGHAINLRLDADGDPAREPSASRRCFSSGSISRASRARRSTIARSWRASCRRSPSRPLRTARPRLTWGSAESSEARSALRATRARGGAGRSERTAASRRRT